MIEPSVVLAVFRDLFALGLGEILSLEEAGDDAEVAERLGALPAEIAYWESFLIDLVQSAGPEQPQDETSVTAHALRSAALQKLAAKRRQRGQLMDGGAGRRDAQPTHLHSRRVRVTRSCIGNRS